MDSIGDFAESRILGQVEDIKQGKSLPPKLEEARAASTTAPAKDISNVHIPDEMMRQILGESFYPQDAPSSDTMPELVWDDPEPEPEPPQKPDIITESTAQELLSLLEEVRGMVSDLKEMTSCGSIGSFMGEPVADPMRGSAKSYRKPTKSSILRDSIRRKIK